MGAVTLLGDDDFREVRVLLLVVFPSLQALGVSIVLLVGALRGFLPFDVVFLAENEHHHVGVLLDGPRFAQIGELRPFVVPLLGRARQLRQRQHRDVQFLGQGLEAASDLRDLLDPAVVADAGRGAHELQVVDDDKAQVVLALQPAGAGAQLADR